MIIAIAQTVAQSLPICRDHEIIAGLHFNQFNSGIERNSFQVKVIIPPV